MSTGHNSSEVDAGQLKAFVERIEHVQSTIDESNADKAEIYRESKSFGYDNRILKKIIARRRIDRQKLAEEDELLSIYLSALGEE